MTVPSFTLVNTWEYLESKLYDSIVFPWTISRPTSLGRYAYWYVNCTQYSYSISALMSFKVYIFFSWIYLSAIIWPTTQILTWWRPSINTSLWQVCTLSILLTTQGLLCLFELIIARIRHLHDSEQQWVSKGVIVDRAILKSNLSLKATLCCCNNNSFFSANSLPTLISSESELKAWSNHVRRQN